MKDSSPYSHDSNPSIKNKRVRTHSSLIPCKKPRTPRPLGEPTTTAALLELKHLDVPLTSSATDSPVNFIRLHPDRPYTIGRSPRRCDFVFADRRVGSRHCQVFYDFLNRKLCVVDGALVSISQFKSRSGGGVGRASLNGVFVNGIRVRGGEAVELSDGDQVSFACSTGNCCSNPVRIGFVIHKIVFEEMYVSDNSQGSVIVSNPKGCKRIFASRADGASSSLFTRASFLLSECRRILRSDDPISYIRTRCRYSFGNGFSIDNVIRAPSSDISRSGVKRKGSMLCETSQICCNVKSKVQSTSVMQHCDRVVSSESNSDLAAVCVQGDDLDMQDDEVQVPSDTRVADGNFGTSSFNLRSTDNLPHVGDFVKDKTCSKNVGLQPGKNFYLNRLAFEDQSSSSRHSVISLPELLHPVQSISQIFIATFTSDILWFLSTCEIPSHLPVTVACHNTERCWSSSTENRTSAPYPEFPNLVVVHPPFPEAIAFGEDLKRHGIGCHHPKLFVLQRDDNIRVIITSANLVPTQWNAVTNTIWWQDFPRRSAPDYSSLFTQFSGREVNQDSKSDFVSYLAGFIATLLTDIPSQAQWIVELAKYDFGGAMGHLVASVPGIHSYKTPYIMESRHYACAERGPSGSSGMKFLGSVEASVVGLSYLFHNATDANGAKLKKLASFLRKSCENAKDLSIILTRNTNIPADANAVSIHVSNPIEFSEGVDRVQLGFLPRNIAKWVSPLWDIGMFRFSGYVCPKEALGAALGGNNKKVRLILHVLEGPKFQDISKMMQPQHVIALCSLVAAIERCTGLWRLQEVLGQYKWPESLDSEFVYGASSIGSINAKFLAEFSAAAGKKSFQFDSEESDPEWGCWNARHESKDPSIRIIFPTIERVKNARCGIFPSKRVLCFSEKTWQRLRTVDILHDAIPYPCDRVGHPMHTKVARRRFQSRTDASSCGWVYCGSHNFSAAAWGRSISTPSGLKTNGRGNDNSSLDQMLHICNYELGIIFTFPQTETDSSAYQKSTNLDDIVLPFVVPAPKYKRGDRPATTLAMWQALSELSEKEREKHRQEEMEAEAMEEILDEDEVVEATDYVDKEKEDEKAYAEILWSQSSQSC
ncbi:uncharacterized protein LOC112179103 isoform X1 [Rosa chinensis]|uniref:uncharacterized protein LOC112179103 isoform X1 n=1 Tax=Rosa chinensis TaxID=74649 RepID=UPI000D094449|nr:uncharacterized protein LOC112179103 isoform X1 [Rosa chinensis]